ncbi:transcriptional regulatory protein Dep1 [Aspergillus ellipticus CBS 707.79]|uniref:Transcriptional regulatory protein Dep1 n=1 Tax=Aspergillus ellipticus CBS 707.79 TaxID=1448320 RepID=A0A319DPB6_9EURO|nr:transcriptional regulatory protein Dep1 [Aspergillus ellipticus CBS 707.79]
MEVAESREPVSVGAPAGADSAVTNGEQNILLDDSLMGDDRSSSLSEIDDVSENIPSDYESPKPEKVAPENDSEAETERIEDSPNFRSKTNIVVSATGYEPSPSKLAQSTTYDDVEYDEEHVADDSPSKPRAKTTRAAEVADEMPGLDDSTLSEGIGKKRKRLESGDEGGTEIDEEDLPPQKRRGSVKSDLSDPPADDIVLTPEPMEEPPKINEEDTAADEIPESILPVAPAKTKRAKKGKRKGRKTRDADDDVDNGALETGVEVDDLGDDDTAERGEEADDGEATAKLEEESAKRVSALESLAVLEREFALLRDKIYDERISKLNRELEMLNGPNPTHPEFLRQLEGVKQYRDAKIKYEHTLFQYRIDSLLNRSMAERAQSHSTFFQRARDIRENHSSAISKQFYSIQHDRFKTDEVSPQHYIPFPTRRSLQISHQTAYNQEVSIMAGVAKYVGFPAAPALSAARPSELDEDLEKMGISIETRAPASQPQSTLPRGAMPAMSSNVFRTAAEEAFLEQTPWANPQHPIHQHQPVPQRPQSRVFENPRAPAFTTPAAQKRMVDIHAPNGSASTIAENSSANNTPYDQEQHPQTLGHFVNPEYDADRRSGFRSLSSSPLDVRKPHPASYGNLDHRPPPGPSQSATYSPPSARLGLFQSTASKRDPSPSMPSRPVNSIHQSAGILGGPSSNQMVAR